MPHFQLPAPQSCSARGAATSKKWGVNLSSISPSLPPSLSPSFPPFFQPLASLYICRLNYSCVCVKDADTLFASNSSYSTLLSLLLSGNKRSNLNFNTKCKMVSIRN